MHVTPFLAAALLLLYSPTASASETPGRPPDDCLAHLYPFNLACVIESCKPPFRKCEIAGMAAVPVSGED